MGKNGTRRGPRIGGDVLAWALIAALLGGCGGRSSTGFPWDGGARDPRDGGGGDGPGADTGGDWRTPPDRRIVDACLPIPAKQVQGKYSGSWSGTHKCPGLSPSKISGWLSFTLSPTGTADSFKVAGTMSGMVDPGLPISAQINGTMGCTSLFGSMPKIIVGSGALIMELSGSLQGIFAAPPGFPNGTWTAKEKGGGKCSSSGSWNAAQ